MLSATKNFVLTFIIALVIFGLIAYMLVGLVLNNLLGVGGSETIPPETTEVPDDEKDPGNIGEIDLSGGNSFNLLLIGTDYRPDRFANYDPEMLEILYGIKNDPAVPVPAPGDIKPKPGSVISDKSFWSPDGKESEDGDLIFNGGFYSVDYRVVETDALVLIRVDKEREQFTYTAFPTDTYVDMSGRYIKLSEIYGRYGLDTLLDKVYAMTGMTIEYRAVVTMDDFPEIIDAIGGISYNVPFDMKYTDVAGGIDIDLQKGAQRLDGEAVLDLLMFNNYENGGSREKTTVEVLKKFISTFLNIINYNRAPAVFAQIEKSVDTNFTSKVFASDIGMIFKYAQNNREIPVTLKQVTVGNETLTAVDEAKTCDTFASYKRIYN